MLRARPHLLNRGCADRYCWGNRGPGEAAGGPAGPTEEPGWATGRQASWVRFRSPWGPCNRWGMGWRAVRGVLGSGSGGLLCPRLMTGMCGGRSEDGEDMGREAGVRGVVLAGAGRRGGGEDRAGEPSVGAPARVGPPCLSSRAAGAGAWSAPVPPCWVLNPVGGLRVGGVSTQPLSSALWQAASRGAFLGGGLCCSVEAQPGEEA